jgi:cytosine/uracil/thiamine/allantoin permease
MARKGSAWVGLDRLSKGQRIAAASAVMLFIFMFFHWFGVKATNTSSLLFAVQSVEAGKNAWEALEYIPIILVVAIVATLVVTALHLKRGVDKESALVQAVLAILGFVSALLILLRIIEPPVFAVERTITYEGTPQFPIFLALLAAVGIAFGSYLAMREVGVRFCNFLGRRS